MTVDLPVMDGGGGSAIANGLHVLIPCKSTFQWHTGVFHGRSTLIIKFKIAAVSRRQEPWTCQVFRTSDSQEAIGECNKGRVNCLL